MARKAGRRGAGERARARREELEAQAVAEAEGQGFVEKEAAEMGTLSKKVMPAEALRAQAAAYEQMEEFQAPRPEPNTARAENAHLQVQSEAIERARDAERWMQE